MLLQKIALMFDGGAADTIRMKEGESGRGVWFDFPFYIAADELGNFRAEFITVKPDNTFVIANAALSNHGDGDDVHTVAFLTLPEQCAAAKGHGSYIIKVWDDLNDNEVIYSACGDFISDDHLLMNGMIESVAEANGYTFPDDFLTIGDLGNIINDNTTSDESTWSSDKINSEISGAVSGIIDDNATDTGTTWSSDKIASSLSPSLEFSTTEHVVGKWIDGRPVYEKTIMMAANSGARHFESYPQPINDVDGLVMWTGGFASYSDPDTPSPSIWGQGAFNDYSWGASISLVTYNGVEYQFGTGWGSDVKIMLHLFYTKSTDL